MIPPAARLCVGCGQVLDELEPSDGQLSWNAAEFLTRSIEFDVPIFTGSRSCGRPAPAGYRVAVANRCLRRRENTPVCRRSGSDVTERSDIAGPPRTLDLFRRAPLAANIASFNISAAGVSTMIPLAVKFCVGCGQVLDELESFDIRPSPVAAEVYREMYGVRCIIPAWSTRCVRPAPACWRFKLHV
jgi:hypothetical protein